MGTVEASKRSGVARLTNILWTNNHICFCIVQHTLKSFVILCAHAVSLAGEGAGQWPHTRRRGRRAASPPCTVLRHARPRYGWHADVGRWSQCRRRPGPRRTRTPGSATAVVGARTPRGEESDDHEVGVVVWRARGLREPWRFKRVCAAQTETHSCGGLRAPFLLPCPSGCSFQSALSTVVVTYGVLK